MRDLQTGHQSHDAQPMWHIHEGGHMPVSPKSRVVVRYRGGALSRPIEAASHRWQSWPPDIGDTAFDIVA